MEHRAVCSHYPCETNVREPSVVSEPVTASVPHRLGKEEATRRLKEGLRRTHGHFGPIATFEEEIWSGDTLHFRLRALGQRVPGRIEVMENTILIEVMLPWLLAKVAERIVPALRRETTLLLEKK